MKLTAFSAPLALALATQAMADTVVVTQWDQFAQSGITAAGPAMDELIATCKPALNGAEVLRTVAPSIGIRDSYRLAVSAGKTPDLAYTWPAASVLAGYARVGALAPLDDYYAKYGWAHVNAFYKGRNSYDGHAYGLLADGRRVGADAPGTLQGHGLLVEQAGQDHLPVQADQQVEVVGPRRQGTEQARRMHGQHLALVPPPHRIGPHHQHRLDPVLVQRAQPVGQDAIDPHTVKVDRECHVRRRTCGGRMRGIKYPWRARPRAMRG